MAAVPAGSLNLSQFLFSVPLGKWVSSGYQCREPQQLPRTVLGTSECPRTGRQHVGNSACSGTSPSLKSSLYFMQRNGPCPHPAGQDPRRVPLLCLGIGGCCCPCSSQPGRSWHLADFLLRRAPCCISCPGLMPSFQRVTWREQSILQTLLAGGLSARAFGDPSFQRLLGLTFKATHDLHCPAYPPCDRRGRTTAI